MPPARTATAGRMLRFPIAMSSDIRLRGVRVHNLKGVDVTIPTRRLVVVTGVSGSGKSSLAFDTLYAEGQRRYVESLSSYARQFLERMEKPRVDEVEGICPAIAIRQRTLSRSPRSTVATVTEIHDHLRLLFARAGRTFCECGEEVAARLGRGRGRPALPASPTGTRLLVGFEPGSALDEAALGALAAPRLGSAARGRRRGRGRGRGLAGRRARGRWSSSIGWSSARTFAGGSPTRSRRRSARAAGGRSSCVRAAVSG